MKTLSKIVNNSPIASIINKLIDAVNYLLTHGGSGQSYTAGDNIQISEDNVISATDTVYDDTEIKESIDKKQDSIEDLDTIRNGATLGSTAVQSVTDGYIIYGNNSTGKASTFTLVTTISESSNIEIPTTKAVVDLLNNNISDKANINSENLSGEQLSFDQFIDAITAKYLVLGDTKFYIESVNYDDSADAFTIKGLVFDVANKKTNIYTIGYNVKTETLSIS